MTPNLRKEFRTLALPAGVVLAMTLLGVTAATTEGILAWQSSMSSRMALLAFFLGTPLIAALPFGAEFQHRTIVLLLSEPVSRARIWVDKWIALLCVVAVLAAVEFVFFSVSHPGDLSVVTLAMFVLMVVCSAPLWTLVSRSTIGGAVFTVSAIMVVELIAGICLDWMAGTRVRGDVLRNLAVFHALRVTYSVATLAVGWWVFARFQAGGAGFTDAPQAWPMLRARRGRLMGNVLRKELMLQRPAFLAAAVFVGTWLVALGVVLLQTERARLADVLFPLLLSIYMPLVVIFAGTIPASEDASLGIKPWHLTLPLSARKQWATKLAVALVVGVLLATVVPWAMIAVVKLVAMGRIGSPVFREPAFFLGVATAVILGFWASTLLGDTVKAALATGGIIVAIALGGSLVTNWAMWAGRADWVVRLVAPFKGWMGRGDWMIQHGFEMAMVMVSLTALGQSLSRYSRLRVSSLTFLRLAAIVFTVGVAALFCSGVFIRALQVNFLRSQL